MKKYLKTIKTILIIEELSYRIKQLFYRIRENLFKILFWYVDYYQINPKKIKKAKVWLNNKLQKITEQEGIQIKYKDCIEKSPTKITQGRYIICGSYKKIELLKSYNYFQKELVWMHELGHHFFKKQGLEKVYFMNRRRW